MVWTIEYATTAQASLKKLDKYVAKRILNYMDQRVATAENPRVLGKALTGPEGGRWRFRVDDYRIVCEIENSVLRVLVLRVGHRGDVYRQH